MHGTAPRAGQGKLAWLVDFKGYGMRNAPSLRVSLATLSILQSHYPERLGLALCYHPPRLFSFTWKV
jgi:polyribonucleotide 5'-hydroxyl-kinase